VQLHHNQLDNGNHNTGNDELDHCNHNSDNSTDHHDCHDGNHSANNGYDYDNGNDSANNDEVRHSMDNEYGHADSGRVHRVLLSIPDNNISYNEIQYKYGEQYKDVDRPQHYSENLDCFCDH
jgi:hypothetical protein